jgi:hypothetical protein
MANEPLLKATANEFKKFKRADAFLLIFFLFILIGLFLDNLYLVSFGFIGFLSLLENRIVRLEKRIEQMERRKK